MELKDKKLLVVEDEQPLIDIICKKLALLGFKTLCVGSVKDAIKFLKENPTIDGIWLDHCLLGKENGLEFVHAVKNHEVWKKIPIFVVSNTASPDKVKTYLELGVEKYYTKADYRLDDILKDIKIVLGKGELNE
ncbi:MAG: response regulator receiver protein [Candidatus Berkelbacteria bacterium]|nr:response regulator receiver protein [Candidatus Berkelbacteria bacterium]